MDVDTSPRGALMIGGALLAAAALAAQAPGDSDVRPWTPAGISSDRFESHAAFDPRTRDLYFVRSARDFSGWRILMSTCGAHGWTPPVPPPFAGPGLEADPFFSADGRTLYFISTRATGASTSTALDIWRVDRDAAGTWAAPELTGSGSRCGAAHVPAASRSTSGGSIATRPGRGRRRS